MRLFNRSFASVGVALLPLSVALTVTNAAHADGCATDADCGHGFTCATSVGSNTGGASAGVGGAAAIPAMQATGGAAVVYFNVGGHGGVPSVAGSAGTTEYCGDGLCETPMESPGTCPADCLVYGECTPAVCTATSDCATDYSCALTDYSNAAGGFGATANGGMPDSGVCVYVPRRCASDSDCSAGMFCDAEVTASGGGGFYAGTPSESAGFGAGGTPAAVAGSSGNDASTPFQGVCDYHSLGVDPPAPGAGGQYAGQTGSSSGGAAPCPGGNCGSGGTGIGGSVVTGAGGSVVTAAGGTTTIGVGIAASGSPATDGRGASAGSTESGGSTATNEAASGAPGHDVFTQGGCSVSSHRGRTSFGGFAFFGLALAWATRRRRSV